MVGVTVLADRVRDERLRRGWSIRQAAVAGGISNTWWGKFEDRQQPLTEAIRLAVAKAYDWPDDWPSVNQPVDASDLAEQVAALVDQMALLAARVARQEAELGRLRKPRNTRGGAG